MSDAFPLVFGLDTHHAIRSFRVFASSSVTKNPA
jgi:hypothetical protein